MSADDARFERAAVQGNVDFPVLTRPVIRGSVRRSDPDGSHAQPFFSGLTGTSLVVEVGGFTSPPAPITINFASDNYAAAVTAVNAAAPLHIQFVESDGFFTIQSIHSGESSFIRINSGTAALILGLAVDPAPGSYSQAGDVAATPGIKGQSSPQTTGLLGHDENLNTKSINRAISSATLGLSRKLWDLDKPIVVYKTFAAAQYNPGGVLASQILKITDSAADTERLSVDALAASFAAFGDLSQAIAVQTNAASPQAYFLSDSAGTLLKISSAAYSPYPAGVVSGTIPWGAPDGSSYELDTTAAFISPKGGSSATAITSIDGGVVYCSGATFVTWQAQVGDQVLISGATNLTPFSHNGVFVITQVIDETHLALRPLGANESTDSTLSKPLALNTSASGSFGNLTVLTGRNPIIVGPSGGANDRLFFFTNVSIDPGTTVKLTIPVITTLREALTGGAFLQNQSFERDGQLARKNQPNTFTKPNTFTNSIASTPAITATGLTGPNSHGISATGGESGGTGNLGVSGNAVHSNAGAGVEGIGAAGANGVVGIGGTNGNGVKGRGTGSGYGVTGTGGVTGGGVSGTGGGSSPGILGQGGTSGGAGGSFTSGTGGNGVVATGDGVGSGAVVTGGTSSAASGLVATSLSTGPAVKAIAKDTAGGKGLAALDPAGNVRFVTNPLGLRGDWVNEINERWYSGFDATHLSGANWVVTLGSGTSSVAISSNSWMNQQTIDISRTDDAISTVIVSLNGWLSTVDPSVLAFMEWESSGTYQSGSRLQANMGFRDESTIRTAYFQADIGTGHWFAHTWDGATDSSVDTGLAYTGFTTTNRKFRIEILGASTDSTATNRVRFYIDGALVADKTSNFPATGKRLQPFFEYRSLSNTGLSGSKTFTVGHVSAAASL